MLSSERGTLKGTEPKVESEANQSIKLTLRDVSSAQSLNTPLKPTKIISE